MRKDEHLTDQERAERLRKTLEAFRPSTPAEEAAAQAMHRARNARTGTGNTNRAKIPNSTKAQ